MAVADKIKDFPVAQAAYLLGTDSSDNPVRHVPIGYPAAENLGFNKADTAANQIAYNALLTDAAKGGVVRLGPGTYDFRFATQPSGLTQSVYIIGAGAEKTKILINTGWALTNVISGNIHWQDVEFDYGATPATSLTVADILEFNNRTANTKFARVVDCAFTNGRVVARSPTDGLATFTTESLELTNIRVRNRNGLCRIMRNSFKKIIIRDNDIDCGNTLGPQAGFGGIVALYVQDGADGFMPEEVGQVRIEDNRIRNLKPTAAPGGSGCYGIQTQSYGAVIRGNTVEKVYPFFGTARSNEALFTGDGSKTTFTGTFANDITPDSFKLKTGGVVVADDNDWGYERCDNNGLIQAGFVNSPTSNAAGARQKIRGLDGSGNVIITGWIDYNTKQYSITFITAPANGVAYVGDYLTGTATQDIEPIYAKSTGQMIIGNKIFDCGNFQGAICSKGGGAEGWLVSGEFLRYSGSGGAQYGGIIAHNVIRNRWQTTVFQQSLGIWIQQGDLLIMGNWFDGLCDRVFRVNTQGKCKNLQIIACNIRDHYGSSIFYTDRDTENVNIDGLNIDGWWGTTGSISTTRLQVARLNAPTGTVKALKLRNITISDRIEVGNGVTACYSNAVAGPHDCVVESFDCAAPWVAFQKAGSNTAGRMRVRNSNSSNLSANLIDTTLVTGTRTSGSAAVAMTAATSQIGAGMPVTGTGIPGGTTIASVDTIERSATRVNGNAVIDVLGRTDDLTVGMTAIATGVAAGATITAIATVVQTGVRTLNSAVITGIPSTAGMSAGQAIWGTGIPYGSTILSVDSSTQVTISRACNAAATDTICVNPKVTLSVAPTSNGDTLFSFGAKITLSANATASGTSSLTFTGVENTKTSADNNYT